MSQCVPRQPLDVPPLESMRTSHPVSPTQPRLINHLIDGNAISVIHHAFFVSILWFEEMSSMTMVWWIPSLGYGWVAAVVVSFESARGLRRSCAKPIRHTQHVVFSDSAIFRGVSSCTPGDPSTPPISMWLHGEVGRLVSTAGLVFIFHIKSLINNGRVWNVFIPLLNN